ncbi:MAG TPA: hypothetical protein VGX23_02545 [Actinocrinis sp.]|nr:hypothetical protein [Actinocrinis sp.]
MNIPPTAPGPPDPAYPPNPTGPETARAIDLATAMTAGTESARPPRFDYADRPGALAAPSRPGKSKHFPNGIPAGGSLIEPSF